MTENKAIKNVKEIERVIKESNIDEKDVCKIMVCLGNAMMAFSMLSKDKQREVLGMIDKYAIRGAELENDPFLIAMTQLVASMCRPRPDVATNIDNIFKDVFKELGHED